MDGLRLECKRNTKENRNNKRSKYGARHDEIAEIKNDDDEDPDQLAQYKKYSAEITRENYYMFLDFLKHKNVEFIVAPYEADSQLAYMYHTKEIDYILSEDSDLVAYGCTKIIRCLKKDGSCKMLNWDKKPPKSNASLRSFMELSEENRTKCCILAGCDYLSNIKGLGFGSIVKIFEEHNDFMERIKQINTKKKIMTKAELNEYFSSFNRAYLAFTEQLVYCSHRERIVNLSARFQLKKTTPLKLLDENYVGMPIHNDKNFVKGLVDFDDLTKKRKPVEMDFRRILQFFDFKTNPNSGRIGNLTLQLVTYGNFDKGVDFADERDVERECALRKRDLAEHRTPSMLKADHSEKDTAARSPSKSVESGLSECNKRVKA